MKLATTTLVFCVAGLTALGLVMLSSASMTETQARHLLLQPLWLALALLACIVCAAGDYSWLKKVWWLIFAVAVALLVTVLVPTKFTPRINGAHRWITFHGVGGQPSELAKLAFIIALAWYGERFQRRMDTLSKGLVIPGAGIAVVLGLIFLEPDWGTTLLLASVGVAMLLVAGVRWKFLVPPVILGLAGLLVALLHNPVRIARIFAWLHPEMYKDGKGYQAYQAMIALGNGGWTGLGLGNGRQKLGFVPEHHTDFIFSIIGEELGLVATLLVVLTFIVIVVCGIYIAWRARDTFGLLLGCGLTLLIGLQAFINIGVVTSVLPNKGLPLPFVSYGGSNLIAMFAAVGLLLNIARHAFDAEKVRSPILGPGNMPSPQLS